jgi:hypothetical protein
MWNLIHESGWAAWMTLLLTVAGAAAVVTIGRRRGRPGSVGASWAVAVLASGALGFATGQRMVDRGVRGVHVRHEGRTLSPEEAAKHPPIGPVMQIQMMSVGTREASSNFLIAGLGATLLCALGGALSLARPKDAQ